MTMSDSLIIFVVIFVALLILIWMALHFGSRWFSKNQNQTASAAKSDLEEMFIFTDASRLMLINIVVLIFLPVVAWFVTGNFMAVGVCVVLAFLAPRFIVRRIARKRISLFE
jgi:tight adherence protein B